MTEPARSVRNRILSLAFPGLPQILDGRWGVGSMALLIWCGHLWIAAASFELIPGAMRGAWDDKFAVLTRVGGLVGMWLWSWFDVSRTRVARVVGVSQWDLALRAFSRNRTAVVGLIMLVLLYLVAILTPLITPLDPLAQAENLVDGRFLGMSEAHLLGTDEYGRDVFTRLLYGARISLTIGLLAMGIAVTIGTLVGSVAGYLGGYVDAVVMRFVDMVISFPRLILLLTIVAVFRPSFSLIVVVLGLTLWPATARIVRGEVLSLREREFVQAAQALGYSKRRIILKHLIPNALAPVIVAATLGVGNTIVLEAGLSFLGVGLPSSTPSWGNMVADGQEVMLNAWWIATFPGLAIVFTVLSFNLVGDGLRDALDPRLRS